MSDEVVHFCTSFDHNNGYVAKGVALYRSLERHAPPFVLWILALSPEAGTVLSRLGLEHARVIALGDLERAEPALLGAKRNRSLLDYYYTLYPYLPSFILATQPHIDRITLLGPRLWFCASASPLIQELGSHSVQVTLDHGFLRTPGMVELNGRFNAGCVTFRRSADGLACLDEWKRQCLQWCYLRFEDGKHGNEKYLDAWPGKYDACISRHGGANVGDWNLHCRDFSLSNGSVLVEGEPLLLMHFSCLRRHSALFYSTPRHYPRLVPVLRKHIYRPYLREVRRAEKDIAAVWRDAIPRKPAFAVAIGEVRRALSVGRAFANGRLVVAW